MSGYVIRGHQCVVFGGRHLLMWFIMYGFWNAVMEKKNILSPKYQNVGIFTRNPIIAFHKPSLYDFG